MRDTTRGFQQHSRRAVLLNARTTSPAPFEFACLQEKGLLVERVCWSRSIACLSSVSPALSQLSPLWLCRHFAHACAVNSFDDPTTGVCCEHASEISVVQRTARPSSSQTWQPSLRTCSTTQNCPFEQGGDTVASADFPGLRHASSASQLCLCMSATRVAGPWSPCESAGAGAPGSAPGASSAPVGVVQRRQAVALLLFCLEDEAPDVAGDGSVRLDCRIVHVAQHSSAGVFTRSLFGQLVRPLIACRRHAARFIQLRLLRFGQVRPALRHRVEVSLFTDVWETFPDSPLHIRVRSSSSRAPPLPSTHTPKKSCTVRDEDAPGSDRINACSKAQSSARLMRRCSRSEIGMAPFCLFVCLFLCMYVCLFGVCVFTFVFVFVFDFVFVVAVAFGFGLVVCGLWCVLGYGCRV